MEAAQVVHYVDTILHDLTPAWWSLKGLSGCSLCKMWRLHQVSIGYWFVPDNKQMLLNTTLSPHHFLRVGSTPMLHIGVFFLKIKLRLEKPKIQGFPLILSFAVVSMKQMLYLRKRGVC